MHQTCPCTAVCSSCVRPVVLASLVCLQLQWLSSCQVLLLSQALNNRSRAMQEVEHLTEHIQHLLRCATSHCTGKGVLLAWLMLSRLLWLRSLLVDAYCNPLDQMQQVERMEQTMSQTVERVFNCLGILKKRY